MFDPQLADEMPPPEPVPAPAPAPRSLPRRVWSFLWTGPLVGALAYAGLFFWCVLRFKSGEYMGVKDDTVIDQVQEMFKDDIVSQQLRILRLYALLGLGLGTLAWLLWRLVSAAAGRAPASGLRMAGRVLATLSVVHGWLVARTLVATPQLLADNFYDKGGLGRWVQTTLTDRVPLGVIDGLGWAALAGVGILLALAVRRHRAALSLPRRLYPASLAAGALLAVPFGMAFHRPTPPLTKDNVIIVAVDSMRPDHMELADRPLPNLKALAEESITFRNAWTVFARTFPSWVSTLTSKYPHEHGIRSMFPTPEALAEPRDTLIKELRRQGYRTAVVSDFAGDVFSRMDFGFEDVRVPRFTLRSNVELGGWKLHYHLLPYLTNVLGGSRTFPILKLWERLADPYALTDEALDWIAQGDGRPFALLIFYSTAHFPYSAPYPHYGLYRDPSYDGPSRYHKAAWTNSDRAPGEDEQRQIVALYDGGLHAADDAIGRLLTQLRGWGLFERSHIVVTADHGENLYEPGLGIGHGDHLRGSVSMKVPLLLHPATFSPVRRDVGRPVRSIDLAPTLLDYLGLPPLPGQSGQSLRPIAEGQPRAEDPPIFFETGLWFINPEAAVLKDHMIHFMQGLTGAFRVTPDSHEIFFDPTLEDEFLTAKHRAILYDGYKLLYIPTRHGVDWELYDVANDPNETDNLITKRADVADDLKRRLKAWMLADPHMVEQGDYVVPRVQ